MKGFCGLGFYTNTLVCEDFKNYSTLNTISMLYFVLIKIIRESLKGNGGEWCQHFNRMVYYHLYCSSLTLKMMADYAMEMSVPLMTITRLEIFELFTLQKINLLVLRME
jgi:hypothetical protein